jgi:transcriptional regulator with XRE-family HTH domain
MTQALVTRQNGAAIRALRRQAGKGVVEIARQIKVHPQTLRNIENGRRSASMRIIRRIARALAVPPKAIIRDGTDCGTEAEAAEPKARAA